jgi:dephospho-CoA kinase
MLERQWAAECADLAARNPSRPSRSTSCVPRSRCRSAATSSAGTRTSRSSATSPARQVLAVRHAIGLRYPGGRIVTGALLRLLRLALRATCKGLAWCGFSAACSALFLIDWDTTLLPDDMNTLPLVWAGWSWPRCAGQCRCSPRCGARSPATCPVGRLQGLQAADRQGRHGLRRLQAVRRARRLVRRRGAGAHHPDGVHHRRGDRHRDEVRGRLRPKAATCRSAPSWPAPACFTALLFGPGRHPSPSRSACRHAMRVGLTGGIGSGKSTVLHMLQALGAGGVDADAISRATTAPGGAAIPPSRRASAPTSSPRRRLDRDRMRERVYADPSSAARAGSHHPSAGGRRDSAPGRGGASGRRALHRLRHPAAGGVRPLARAGRPRAGGRLPEPETQVARVVARSGLPEAQVRPSSRRRRRASSAWPPPTS